MKYKLEQPVQGNIGTVKYQCSIQWRNGQFICDEPESAGGSDTGPDPFTLLLASLASCTLITLRMYIDRKGWDIPHLAVNANLYQEIKEQKLISTIDRDIIFTTPVPDEQRLRLQEIAKACPISKLLENEVKVRTFIQREDTEKQIKYGNDAVTVVWKPELCQHSTRCWTQLPLVFKPAVKKWIDPSGAPAEKIEAQVKQCPSGALQFYYNNQPPAKEE
ncbi:MAG TPA: (4Fe-4S)-binding protein [Ferruginibacter sp.]|nr:(4Fe-4S)-binding protein [Ferruginibacter sp.]HMP19564.1 (4Fe-4S)-binding protein [Ferruginibacter sp.]